MSTEISYETALATLSSDQEFCIDFDLAWKWVGYSRKDHAKHALLSAGFEENVDYVVSISPNSREIGNLRGRSPESIHLNYECFVSFCMLAHTEQGNLVRRYFIKAEKELRQLKTNVPTVRDNVDALAKLTSSLQYLESSLGVNLKNPRWNQHLQDIALTTLGVGQQPALPAAPEAKWQGVREAAEELGFMSVAVNKASQLGKLVKAGYPELEVVTEERLCNGVQRPIRLYKVTPAFLNAVKTVCQKLS